MSCITPARYCLDSFRAAIASQLSRTLGVSHESAYAAVDYGRKGSDFTVPVPRLRLKEKPDVLTKKVMAEFQADEHLESVNADGVFIHYQCHTANLIKKSLSEVYRLSQPASADKHGSYGKNTSGQGKRVIMEYSSPNIAKPFHAGHLRSTIIGAFLANIYEASGWEVIRMNYLGDWGKQFGLLLVGYERYGSEEALSKNAIMHLFDVYVAVNKDLEREKESGQAEKPTDTQAREIFRLLQDGNEEKLAIWRRFRTLSITVYEKVYARLGIHFDVYFGESLVKPEIISRAMKTLREKGLVTTKSMEESRQESIAAKKGLTPSPAPLAEDADTPDAFAIDMKKWKLEKPVIEKSDGTTTYLIRDVAGAIQRYEEYKFDKMIYVVGDQQDLHVRQFFKILSLMEVPFADRLTYINFGRIQGMSTRKGEVRFLDDILDSAQEAMLAQMMTNEKKMQDIDDPNYASDEIGMTCVKIQDMSAKRINSYKYDSKRMTSFEGDTGAYLQYAHVRLCSIQRKVAPTVVLRNDPDAIDTSLLTEPEAREIVFMLASYPDVVLTALGNHEPCTIVSYCFKLSHLVSSAWQTLIVLGQETELAQARLYLFTCTRHVLASAMRLLGLKPLERM